MATVSEEIKVDSANVLRLFEKVVVGGKPAWRCRTCRLTVPMAVRFEPWVHNCRSQPAPEKTEVSMTNVKEWTNIPRAGQGPGAKYGPAWVAVPAVAFTLNGITFNRKFHEAFIKDANQILLSFSGRTLGIKIVKRGEEQADAFNLTPVNSTREKQHYDRRHVSTKQVGQRFPDCVGLAYRAQMNGTETIIEVELSNDNKLRR